PQGYRVPTRGVPDWLFRAAALFDRTSRLALVDLGQHQHVSSVRAQTVLGFTHRPLADMVIDMGESMIAHGAIRATRGQRSEASRIGARTVSRGSGTA